MIRVALIGFGAMGRSLASTLQAWPQEVQIECILERPQIQAQWHHALPAGSRFVSSASDLSQADVQVVVECAGHAALARAGAEVLMSGRNLLVASVGALADMELESGLRRAAARGHSRLLIPSGALGALDILAASRLAGLRQAIYRCRKPPVAWMGTAADRAVDLAALTGPCVFFEGTARQAAMAYPQNANVAAAVALAGMGFDNTLVQLAADPRADGNHHAIEAVGDFGSFEFNVRGNPLADNPKTSTLAPFSLAKSILHLNATISFA